MDDQGLTWGQKLSFLTDGAQRIIPKGEGLGEFRRVLLDFLVKLSPHLVMQDMGTAPKDRPILVYIDADEPLCIVKYQSYEENEAEPMDGDPEGGFWCPEESLIADVCGALDPLGWWELPTVQSIGVQSIAQGDDATANGD